MISNKNHGVQKAIERHLERAEYKYRYTKCSIFNKNYISKLKMKLRYQNLKNEQTLGITWHKHIDTHSIRANK